MGYVTAHWEELGHIPPQGIPHTDGVLTAEGNGWYVGVLPTVGGESGGGPT